MKSDIQYADEIYQIQGAIFAVYKEMGRMLGMKKFISSVSNENYHHEVFHLTLRKS